MATETKYIIYIYRCSQVAKTASAPAAFRANCLQHLQLYQSLGHELEMRLEVLCRLQGPVPLRFPGPQQSLVAAARLHCHTMSHQRRTAT